MEPTSEQELKDLLDEGKISEDEYRQLLEALQQKQTTQPQPPAGMLKKPARSGYGKAALVLMIVGIFIQIAGVCMSLFQISRAQYILLGGFGAICEILAFIFGIIGWKSKAGKIAVIGVPCLWLIVPFLIGFFMAFIRTAVKYEPENRPVISHKVYPLDSLEGVLTQDVILDDHISADGNGSLRIQTDTADKSVFRLFETGPMGIEDKMLFYSAKLKSQLLEGKAYLEMWCDIPGKGEFFSRGLENPVTGTTEWTNVETPFRLETGQMPANVKLNLVMEGIGTVWIDDIQLLLSPL